MVFVAQQSAPQAHVGIPEPPRAAEIPAVRDRPLAWAAAGPPCLTLTLPVGPRAEREGLVGQVPGRAGSRQFALLKGLAGGKGSLLVFPVHLKKNPLVSE